MTPQGLAQTLIRGACTNVVQEAAHEPSFWLRVRLADLDARHATTQLRSCGHPGPYLVALWAADGAWCMPCAVSALAVDDQESFRCDRCGILSNPITLATVIGAHAVVIFGLCRDCAGREVAA